MQADLARLILRMALGGFMLTHGWPKMQTLWQDWGSVQFPDPLSIGATASLLCTVVAEFLCALLVIIGYKTRWAAVPLIITMAIAAFVVHGPDPFAKKEMALLYLSGYLAIALLGPGKWSVDRR